jgi:hypothetical protein
MLLLPMIFLFDFGNVIMDAVHSHATDAENVPMQPPVRRPTTGCPSQLSPARISRLVFVFFHPISRPVNYFVGYSRQK